MFAIKALDRAEGYFGYVEEEAIGEWIGEGASTLGLTGEVTDKEFIAVCRAEDPRTGEYLLPRTRADQLHQRTILLDGEAKQIHQVYKARQAYDLVFSAPKTVSIQGLYDSRMLECHEKALAETIKHLESLNGKLVIAAFQHRTSRAGDPHIHTHLVVANMQPVIGGWRSVDAKKIYRSREMLQDYYEARVLVQAQRLGYREVERFDSRHLDGIPNELYAKFSRRSEKREDVIDQYREKNGLPADYRPTNRQVAKLVYWNRRDKEVLAPVVSRVRQLSRLEPAEHDTLFRLKEQALERQSLAERPDYLTPRIPTSEGAESPSESPKSKLKLSLDDHADAEAGLREQHWNYGEGQTYKSGSRMRVG